MRSLAVVGHQFEFSFVTIGVKLPGDQAPLSCTDPACSDFHCWREFLKLSRHFAGLAPYHFPRGLSHSFIQLRPRQRHFRSQRVGDRIGLPLASRHAAHIRWVTPYLLRHSIVDSTAQRGQASQIRNLHFIICAIHGRTSVWKSRRQNACGHYRNADGTSRVLPPQSLSPSFPFSIFPFCTLPYITSARHAFSLPLHFCLGVAAGETCGVVPVYLAIYIPPGKLPHLLSFARTQIPALHVPFRFSLAVAHKFLPEFPTLLS
jgi:hypothetical protein